MASKLESVLHTAEAALVDHAIGPDTGRGCPALFILGAPRTGSTVFFQALVEAFRLPYFSNLINDYFFETPVLGLAIQAGVEKIPQINFTSRYGKTKGLLQPSEGSHVLRNWFGGGHPSQLVSTTILPGKLDHIRRTLQAAHLLFGRPLCIKNAWNCFRVANLSQILPDAFFIWIRRDIAASAKSDLLARYEVQGSPLVWNSATPHNVDALRQRPYWEQVIENQYEFSLALERDLNAHTAGRFCEIWYEDFCSDTSAALRDIALAWSTLAISADLGVRRADIQRSNEQWSLPENDIANIDAYVETHAPRLTGMRHKTRRTVDQFRGADSTSQTVRNGGSPTT